MREENGNLLADSHNILSGLKKYSPKIFNVQSAIVVKQIEILTTKPLYLIVGLLRLSFELRSRKNVNCRIVMKLL
jgi:hypothetical protein